MAADNASLLGTYAIIRSGGKQYTVTAGQRLLVNKLLAEPGEHIVLSDVLLVKESVGKEAGQASKLLVGSPLVSGASVKAKVLAQTKGEKIRIFKKKRRKGYTKRQGHRQLLTELLIESIVAP